jgi:hypothetical protein
VGVEAADQRRSLPFSAQVRRRQTPELPDRENSQAETCRAGSLNSSPSLNRTDGAQLWRGADALGGDAPGGGFARSYFLASFAAARLTASSLILPVFFRIAARVVLAKIGGLASTDSC